MKIAIGIFQQVQYGGIIQCITDMKSGFELLGHEVSVYEFRYKETLWKAKLNSEYSERITKSNVVLDSKKLYFGCSENNDFTLSVLNSYDAIIFQRGCPAENSKYGKESGISWTALYEATPPKYVVIHDPWMYRYYQWQEAVIDKIEAICPIHLPSWAATDYWIGPKAWIPFPVDFRPMLEAGDRKLIERPNLLSFLCVWKPWNHPDIMLKNMPHIDDNVDVELYGKGISYHYMAGTKSKRKSKYKLSNGEWLWESVNAAEKYKGIITTEEKWLVFGDSRMVVSLSYNPSWLANTVRVVVEGIGSGAITFAYPDNIGIDKSGKGGLIPPEAVVLLSNRKTIHPEINEVASNIESYQEKVDVGRKLVIETFDHVKICQTWLDLIESGTSDKFVEELL